MTQASGNATKKLYQTRGLRQGCNLSSILFVLYITDLGHAIERAKKGMTLPSGTIIGSLMSADDIILLANNEQDLNVLKNILENWCSRFKMKISVKKTQVISPDQNHSVNLIEPDLVTKLDNVEQYKYLGIWQKITVKKTTNLKQRQMIEKGEMHRGLITKMRYTLPD